jgi:hypothetical protein
MNHFDNQILDESSCALTNNGDLFRMGQKQKKIYWVLGRKKNTSLNLSG